MIDSASDIRFLERNEIDTAKWDRCIENAANGLIYARSFYLDTMAKNWSALVLGDYEAIMPLPWNRKYFIYYLYQPIFTAQLGLFSLNGINDDLIEEFLTLAEKKFAFCEMHLNYYNKIIGLPFRSNYVLNLNRSYTEIRNEYKKRLLVNLKEADSQHLQYSSSEDFLSTVTLYELEYGNRFRHLKTKHFNQFRLLCTEMRKRDLLFVREVKNSFGNLLSSSIFFMDRQRIYNIMSVTLKAGREKRSHFHLIDQLIREYSTRDLVLDFEGSELPGVAEFYRKFGPRFDPYPFLKFNHLPFIIRLFK